MHAISFYLSQTIWYLVRQICLNFYSHVVNVEVHLNCLYQNFFLHPLLTEQ